MDNQSDEHGFVGTGLEHPPNTGGADPGRNNLHGIQTLEQLIDEIKGYTRTFRDLNINLDFHTRGIRGRWCLHAQQLRKFDMPLDHVVFHGDDPIQLWREFESWLMASKL